MNSALHNAAAALCVKYKAEILKILTRTALLTFLPPVLFFKCINCLRLNRQNGIKSGPNRAELFKMCVHHCFNNNFGDFALLCVFWVMMTICCRVMFNNLYRSSSWAELCHACLISQWDIWFIGHYAGIVLSMAVLNNIALFYLLLRAKQNACWWTAIQM